MPIIDPSLQCFLVKNIKETEGKSGYSFILKYLQIASRNLKRNLCTISSSIYFKRDFERNLSTINDKFKCDIRKLPNMNTYFQRDCYKYFYKHIKIRNKEEKSKKFQGRYKICNDKFGTRFFEPYVFYSKYHSWNFSDTPIAILSINSETFTTLSTKNKEQIINFIKLEIDLISSSGLTLILCFNYNPIMDDFIKGIIIDNQFSEIHCNIFNDKHISTFLHNMKELFQQKNHKFLGYFYLYCHYVEKNTEERTLMKEFKQQTHVTINTFSKSPDKSLIDHEFIPTKPFSHCKSGFEHKYLRIFINYVPLYDSETDEGNFIPKEVSNICLGYISTTDFLRMSFKRVKIIIEEEEKEKHCRIMYVNYEDIHCMRSEFFVEDPLLLTKMEEGEFYLINKIKDDVEKKTKKVNDFHQNSLFNLLNTRQYKECLRYVSEAYLHFIKNSIPDFSIHRAQIYAAFEACKSCFSIVKDPNGNNTKGVIYQVETGEGKTCIICLIAAVLAIKKYTVHIASSNINLSNRDYYNSYDFFKLLGLKSAVLLHKNELPFKNEDSMIGEGAEEEENGEIPLKNIDRDEEDDFFKSNADYYFEINTKKSNESYRKNYPKEFYGDELFKNSSRMNFTVCGLDNDNNITKNKANVIFSTFVNFECFYMHLMEMCPAYIDKYFKKCGLLIDEADSILIDEIKNGTIVSREIKSNAKEILTFVYIQKMNGETAESTYQELKKKPMCDDITLTDIEEMYKEIELVNSEEYINKRKYLIDTFKVRNNHRIRNLIKKTIDFIINIKDKISDFVDSKIFKNDDDDGNEDDEEEDDEFDTSSYKTFHQIIPFDNEHKGTLERNKEFSGFIQQFISLKESITNKNEEIIFKEISMNYLYVSHPIFVNLYSKICGFTGTIGTYEDKKIYKEHYNLITKKVPRNKPNLRVNFPTIICENITERNEKIVTEIIDFHLREIPVLVIFQDLNEIEDIQKMLYIKGIRNINIFNGKDEFISPDVIAGINGSVSLGTNVCGRGTDIRISELPLHVIISFYSSNIRVMNQAFGRTARQGQNGTCRCICDKNQYHQKNKQFDIIKTKESVSEFEYKIISQRKFIEHYKKTRPWIFEFNIGKQSIPEKYIKRMRKARINVNRIVAYQYKFPICMTIPTFLKIQSQKIFSLFNCPNSKYTWRLFQRHVREMILESWSIMINNFEQFYKKKCHSLKYHELLDKQIDLLHNALKEYLPDKHYNIVSTFMHIHRIVRHKYEKTILGSFKKLSKAFISFGNTYFTRFQLGFKPYSLLSRSGARICYNNIGETNYIEDPELKYMQKMPDNSFTFLSITERIDQIFNSIFQKISETIGEKFYIKFFLRRTLAGCEFGLCFDLNLSNCDANINNQKYCLIDKNPLLVFTIFLWSMAPLMAGILIYVLVYVIGLTKKIISWTEGLPVELSKEAIKLGVVSAINIIVPKAADFFLERIISFLEKVLDNQIAKLDSDDKEIVESLKSIFLGIDFEKSGEIISDKISSFLGGFIKLPKKFGDIIENSIDGIVLMKIGFLILLCLGTYMKNFMNHKKAIKNAESNAKSYDSTFDNQMEDLKSKEQSSVNAVKETDSPEIQLNKIIENEKIGIELQDIPAMEEEKQSQLENKYKKVSQTFEFKFKTLNLTNYTVDLNEFQNDDTKETITTGYCTTNYMIQKNNNTSCLCLSHDKDDYTSNWISVIKIYALNNHPAIASFIGYSTKGKRILIKNPGYGFLGEYLDGKNPNLYLNSTEKLIISYGIACAMEFLHNRKIVHRDLRPENILLDSQLYPQIFNFVTAINIDDLDEDEEKIDYTAEKGVDKNLFYVAPEGFINKENSKKFPIDVFSYAAALYEINLGSNAIAISKKNLINAMKKIMNGERPEFPDSFSSSWRNLIERCWGQDPNKRPSFTEICDLLESSIFVNPTINISAFNEYKKIVKQFRPLHK